MLNPNNRIIGILEFVMWINQVIAVIGSCLFAQNVGIGTTTPHNSAILELNSTSRGFLVPRMTQAQRIAIATPATGLLVYQADGSSGYWYFNGTDWVQLETTGNNWNITGNTGILDGVNFIGTVNNVPLNVRVNNQLSGRIDHLNSNAFWGYQAGMNNTTGIWNTAVGDLALRSNTIGVYNTALGRGALLNNTTANRNVAVGTMALQMQSFNSGGVDWNSDNVALGVESLYSNQPNSTNTGIRNVAVGNFSLRSNTTGSYNVGIGFHALYSNTTASSNTACGYQALLSNTIGSGNTAVGFESLTNNTTASNNVAIGYRALHLQD